MRPESCRRQPAPGGSCATLGTTGSESLTGDWQPGWKLVEN